MNNLERIATIVNFNNTVSRLVAHYKGARTMSEKDVAFYQLACTKMNEKIKNDPKTFDNVYTIKQAQKRYNKFVAPHLGNN